VFYSDNNNRQQVHLWVEPFYCTRWGWTLDRTANTDGYNLFLHYFCFQRYMQYMYIVLTLWARRPSVSL